MSILIKGVKMPQEGCAVAVIFSDGETRVYTGKPVSVIKRKAVPIPPHGRLIDADALKKSIDCTDTDERKVLSTRQLHNALIGWIDGRHTIIPAEGISKTENTTEEGET